MAKKVIAYPKKFSFPKGLSTEAVYIVGPEEWRDSLIDKLANVPLGLTFLIGSGELTDWDLQAVQDAEIALFSLTADQSNLLYLAMAGQLAQYTTRSIVLTDGEVSGFLKLLKDVKQLKDPKDFDFEVRSLFGVVA
jgi:hypothetical protein